MAQQIKALAALPEEAPIVYFISVDTSILRTADNPHLTSVGTAHIDTHMGKNTHTRKSKKNKSFRNIF